MTNKKPILNNGFIIYKDYEYLFNFLSDDELGKVIRTLLNDCLNPTLNPTDSDKINNVYNYIASRIIKYQEKSGLYSEWGKKGGNPTLKGKDMGGDNPRDKLIEPNITKTNKTNKTNKTKVKIFSPPSPEKVKEYCLQRKNSVDYKKWHNFYMAKGWKIGNNKMKDWRAAVRTWEEKVEKSEFRKLMEEDDENR